MPELDQAKIYCPYTLEKSDEIKFLDKKSKWYEIEYLEKTEYAVTIS